jgi:hypothetical protein
MGSNLYAEFKTYARYRSLLNHDESLNISTCLKAQYFQQSKL